VLELAARDTDAGAKPRRDAHRRSGSGLQKRARSDGLRLSDLLQLGSGVRCQDGFQP
jgi:hypothetical protein